MLLLQNRSNWFYAPSWEFSKAKEKYRTLLKTGVTRIKMVGVLGARSGAATYYSCSPQPLAMDLLHRHLLAVDLIFELHDIHLCLTWIVGLLLQE